MRQKTKIKDSLFKKKPKLAKEWHPVKNGNLTPKDVTPGSNKKVWWICRKGHKWKAQINSRNEGHGCPYCCGQKACKDNCLATKNPKLAKEWHPEKNGVLTPADVTPGSEKKVWWVCKKGHEWRAVISSRNNKRGCPYCSGQRVCKDNCLATLKPKLAKEWHPEKNGTLTPKDVIPNSYKKAWWKCRKGHEWQQIISRKKLYGCPYCSGQKVCKDNCLAAKDPKLAKEWHPEKNGTLTPKDVTPGSHRKVWWKCRKGHEWQQRVFERKYIKGCVYCSGRKAAKENCLATLNPVLAKEWHPVKNGVLTPADVTPGSGKKVWWKCKKGHAWLSKISHRKENGCPYCSGRRVCKDNCLATINPKLSKEWHPVKNGTLTPNDVTPGSGKKVWWKCKKGHEWFVPVCRRVGCPYCSGSRACKDNCLATKCPELAKEWHPVKNGTLTPNDVTPGSGKKVWWKCAYGHEWLARICCRSRGSGCPGCFRKLQKEGFYSYSHTPSVRIRRRKKDD